MTGLKVTKLNELKYKNTLIEGIREKYQFTPKLKDLNSILSPVSLKNILRKAPADYYEVGRFSDNISLFENVKSGKYRINLHVHTNKSDGAMSPAEYLEQSLRYANKVAKLSPKDRFPAYISATTDHNNMEAAQEIVAMIADEPAKYKNFKFVPGCEFMFLDEASGFKFPAFEVIGLGINPFSKSILDVLDKFNPISLIEKIKEFGGVLSYAHPSRYSQGNGLQPEFIKYLINIGINGIESNYQYIGIKHHNDLQAQIVQARKIATENNLYKTGGTDTHGKNIFHSSVQKIIDELI